MSMALDISVTAYRGSLATYNRFAHTIIYNFGLACIGEVLPVVYMQV